MCTELYYNWKANYQSKTEAENGGHGRFLAILKGEQTADILVSKYEGPVLETSISALVRFVSFLNFMAFYQIDKPCLHNILLLQEYQSW